MHTNVSIVYCTSGNYVGHNGESEYPHHHQPGGTRTRRSTTVNTNPKRESNVMYKHISEVLNEQIAKGIVYHVHCTVSGARRLGRVLRFNQKTVVVKVMSGARTSFVIKRHKVKHHLRLHLKG